MADEFEARAATVTVREGVVVPLTALRLRKPSSADLDRIGALIGTPLPMQPNHARDGTMRTIWTGPDQWLIVGCDTAPDAIEAAATDAAAALAVRVTDGRCMFEVTGIDAAELLAKGTSLDITRLLAATDRSALTLFSQANTLIDRPAGLNGYRLFFDISLRDYLRRWFRDAVVEFS